MNNNNNNKLKEFLRKDSFYIILFVCLCVVAGVSVFTINRNNNTKQENEQSEITLNVGENNNSETTSDFIKQNAERVENTENNHEIVESTGEEVAENEINETEVAEAITDEEGVEVNSGTTEVVFSLPLDGEFAISREFGKMIRTYSDENRTEDMSRGGIDISAAVGTPVKASAEGQVEEISGNTTDGTYIVISHANGLKTIYTNLSEEVNVAVGDVVEAGTEIGTVGNTSGVFTSQVCGDVLNVQVKDSNGNDVDPSAYFNIQ